MQLLTIPEAAGRLGVGESTLRRLAASGEIKGAVRIGRDWALPASALAHLNPRPVGRPAKPVTKPRRVS
jgi:excisionase family DNA binding protein